MEHPNTKTQSLTIFIILLSQIFSIVTALGGHHNQNHNHMQNPVQPNVNLAPPSPLTNNQNYAKRKRHRHRHRQRAHVLQSEDQEFLEAHNKVRLQLGQPPFIWDPEIAAYARMWANKRKYDCRMVHSYGAYGENIFWGLRLHWTPSEIVSSWASEVEFYNPTSNECKQQEDCGHYTQIVWRDSTKLGCARIVCENEQGLLGVCSYDPPGNYENESPFTSYNDPAPVTPTPAPIAMPIQPPSLPMPIKLPPMPIKPQPVQSALNNTPTPVQA